MLAIPLNLTDIYAYTSDLLCLDFCRRTGNTEFPGLRRVATPLDVGAWAAALSQHPDRAFARYICQGLQVGFRLASTVRFVSNRPQRTRDQLASTPQWCPSTLRKNWRWVGCWAHSPSLPSWLPFTSIASELSRKATTLADGGLSPTCHFRAVIASTTGLTQTCAPSRTPPSTRSQT